MQHGTLTSPLDLTTESRMLRSLHLYQRKSLQNAPSKLRILATSSSLQTVERHALRLTRVINDSSIIWHQLKMVLAEPNTLLSMELLLVSARYQVL